MKITYLKPIKIITFEGEFNNLDSLLTCEIDQPSFYFNNNFTSKDGGYIVLDFGREISGGLRIVNQGSGAQSDNNKIRIRFGESVSEVMFELKEHNSTNNHSPRDFEYILPDFSKVEVGDTGFRFVRIDFPKGVSQRIYSINAVSKEIEQECFSFFKSNNEELNKIFDAAARTAKLCVNDYIVDGVKRDRLVWVGDLFIELKSLIYLYGNLPEIEKTFLFIENTNPMPSYIQNMPTYSLWYLACLNEYFKQNGFNDFLKERKPYAESILKIIDSKVADDGSINFDENEGVAYPYFIDWRTSEDKNVKDSNPCFYLYLLNQCKAMFELFSLDSLLTSITEKLNKFNPQLFNVSQFDCFSLLSNKGNKDQIIDSVLTSRESEFSPFSYYFVLESMFESKPDETIDMFKNYNIAMINLGATTFFEEFDYAWKDSVKLDELPSDKFNFLTDTGSGCYLGLRKSLCHGWASGPVSFIIENIVGFKGVDKDTVMFKPFLKDLSEFECNFNCSCGLLKVTYKNGRFDVVCPNGYKVKIL